MASGFIVLADGRCFARRWSAYDDVLRAVAAELEGTLQAWLLSLLPGSEDEEHLGHGPWLRKSDQLIVERFLDIRELTTENQRRFHDAVKRANERITSSKESVLKVCLSDLADMVNRADRGETPLSRSDWRTIKPPQGKRIGPDW
jgi:hypothetical protein